jgi:hypothetical protein
MSPGYMVECKLCHSNYLTWEFVVGVDYYVVEFSAGTVKVVIACCDMSRM